MNSSSHQGDVEKRQPRDYLTPITVAIIGAIGTYVVQSSQSSTAAALDAGQAVTATGYKLHHRTSAA